MDAIVTIKVRLENMLGEEDFKTPREATKMVKEIIEENGINGLVSQSYFGMNGTYKITRVQMDKT